MKMRRKLLFAPLPFLIIFLLGLGAEVYLRAQPLGKEFAQYLFFTEFKVSRWDYLQITPDRLIVDVIMNSPGNDTYIEPPEPNRPPFDQVAYPFEVVTNSQGFRDIEFQTPTEKTLVMYLGDSVTFGKGVAVNQRFSDLLRKEIPQLQSFNYGLQGCTAECMELMMEHHINKFPFDAVVLQTSGNDVDQTLWNQSKTSQIPGMSLAALKWVKKSYLLQKFMFWRGKDGAITQMELASRKTQENYQRSINKIFKMAKDRGVKVISLNLPFAYGWNYGGHISRACTEGEHCWKDVKVQFSNGEQIREKYKVPQPTHKRDFCDKTATLMGISEQDMRLVFAKREFYHDIVHLNPLGHAAVADKLMEVMKELVESDSKDDQPKQEK
jgi:hypothetical protein